MKSWFVTGLVAALVLGGVSSLLGASAAAAEAPTGSISGAADQPGLNPFDYDTDVVVSLWLADDDSFIDLVTSQNGQYQFTGLPDADYKLQFEPEDPSSPFTPEWWQDAPHIQAAAVVTVTAGAAITGIDGHLSYGSSISGMVTLENGAPRNDAGEIDVRAYKVGGGLTTSGVGGSGKYTIAGLTPGTYRLQFYPDGTNDYVPEDYSQMLIIGQDEHIDGIDIELGSSRVSVYGLVLDGQGQPIPGSAVNLYSAGDVLAQHTTSGFDGAYSFKGVPDGQYNLAVAGPDPSWLPSEGMPVSISGTGPAEEVSVTLSPVVASTAPPVSEPVVSPQAAAPGLVPLSPTTFAASDGSGAEQLAATGAPVWLSWMVGAGLFILCGGIVVQTAPRAKAN